MSKSCRRQPSTQGQGVLVSSVTASGGDLGGRACRRQQVIKPNGSVVIVLILLRLWRHWLFTAIQRHLAKKKKKPTQPGRAGASSCFGRLSKGTHGWKGANFTAACWLHFPEIRKQFHPMSPASKHGRSRRPCKQRCAYIQLTYE